MTHPHLRHRSLVLALVLPVVAPACMANTVEDESGAPVLACELGAEQRCHQQLDPDHEGVQTCEETDEGRAWSECGVNLAKGKDDCDTSWQVWNGFCCAEMVSGCCPGDECMTPLVLAFENEPVRFTSAPGATFDLSGRELSHAFDWPTAATPWLALDRDGSGRIESGAELFGSAVERTPGVFARNGFEALAEFDANGDGGVDARDPVWRNLVVWRDRNSDRVSEPSELESVTTSGLARIELAYRIAPECDARGNCAIERASFEFLDRGQRKRGRVIDVHLRVR